MATKACDTCKSAAGSGFMCLSCDSTIHSANNKLVSSRVWMCEVCEEAPAAVTCKADAAALCITCDADIHSANHLAHRHHRVPVPAFLNSQQQDVVSGSWLLPTLALMETNHIKTGDLVFSQMDPSQFQQYRSVPMDNVVPVQIKPATIPVVNDESSFHTDFSQHQLSTFSFQSQSLSHSVSSSSVDVGVVPDGNSLSDISYPMEGAMTDPGVLISAKTSNSRAGGMDREARVLRYKEKRNKRKFEKTVRYASRKAYAESRPRIKGRFVKRSQIHNQVNHMYNSATAHDKVSFHLLRVD